MYKYIIYFVQTGTPEKQSKIPLRTICNFPHRGPPDTFSTRCLTDRLWWVRSNISQAEADQRDQRSELLASVGSDVSLLEHWECQSVILRSKKNNSKCPEHTCSCSQHLRAMNVIFSLNNLIRAQYYFKILSYIKSVFDNVGKYLDWLLKSFAKSIMRSSKNEKCKICRLSFTFSSLTLLMLLVQTDC